MRRSYPTRNPFARFSVNELQRKAISCRNRRDAFSFGSPHADEAVQELARIERELERRRNLRLTGQCD